MCVSRSWAKDNFKKHHVYLERAAWRGRSPRPAATMGWKLSPHGERSGRICHKTCSETPSEHAWGLAESSAGGEGPFAAWAGGRSQRAPSLGISALQTPAPSSSSSSGSRALRKPRQAGGTRQPCSVAMATGEARAAWSIWKESPCYGELKGKVLRNAERLGGVIRLAAFRVECAAAQSVTGASGLSRRKDRTRKMQNHSEEEDVRPQAGMVPTPEGFLPWSSWFALSPCQSPALEVWPLLLAGLLPSVAADPSSAALGGKSRRFSARDTVQIKA